MIVFDNMDSIRARAIDGPVEFVRQLFTAPWIFEERYLPHVVFAMNASMELLQQNPEWDSMEQVEKDVQVFIVLLHEVSTDLTSGDPF